MQIASTKLTARRLPLIICLLLPNSLLLLSGLKSIITIRRIRSCGRSFATSLAKDEIKIKACLLPVRCNGTSPVIVGMSR